MQRRIILAVGLLIVGFLYEGGCGANQKRISIVGSTSVQPLADALAEKYHDKDPKLVINAQGGGSSAGIKAVKDGTAEIGASSRELKPEEQTKDLVAVVIARDGIAVVVHPTNSVTNLSLEQLRRIYSGAITNWSQLGGINRPIMVVNREEGSGTRTAFTDLVMGKIRLSTKTIVQASTGAVRQAVSGNPAAIGYLSLDALDRSVKGIEINGIACTAETIKQKKYSLVRPFLFLYRKPEKPGVKEFINYVTGQGQKVVQENGLVTAK